MNAFQYTILKTLISNFRLGFESMQFYDAFLISFWSPGNFNSLLKSGIRLSDVEVPSTLSIKGSFGEIFVKTYSFII